MKNLIRRISICLLAGALLVPFSSCADHSDDRTEDTQNTAAVTGESETERTPYVKRASYNEDFAPLYCADTFREGYYFIDEEDRQSGNELDDRLFERATRVNEYLGVTIKPVNGGNFQEYAQKIKQSVQTTSGDYHMVMSHVYMDIPQLITKNFVRDFKEFDSLNIEADYWNHALMNELSINDKMMCGYNDFCLSSCYIIGFNKHMAEQYANKTGSLYDLVRNKQWTLSRLMEISQLPSFDNNGDGQWTPEDNYGFSGMCWVPLISFQTASDIPFVQKDSETGSLYISPVKDNKDKILDLTHRLFEFKKSDCSFLWHYSDPMEKQVHLRDGKVLFEMLNNFDLVSYKGEDVKVGILPYPLYDEKQADYQTLSWNGVLMIPNDVKNPKMVGDAIEMLAFFSEPVKTAFFENLLGSQVADAPDDVEMLNLIWRTQVSDLGLVFDNSSSGLDNIVYAIPQLLLLQNSDNYMSQYKKNERTAQKGLDNLFREKK